MTVGVLHDPYFTIEMTTALFFFVKIRRLVGIVRELGCVFSGVLKVRFGDTVADYSTVARIFPTLLSAKRSLPCAEALRSITARVPSTTVLIDPDNVSQVHSQYNPGFISYLTMLTWNPASCFADSIFGLG